MTILAFVRSHRDLTIVGTVVAWIVIALLLDADSGIGLQRVIGAITWLILIALLLGEERAVQAQVAVAVLFATAIEFTASAWLGLYTYRLENVPSFVPPGHGGVYLAAIALARAQGFSRIRHSVSCLVLVTGAAWALWGVILSTRTDTLGMLMFILFAGFMLLGRAPLVYAAVFIITSGLELYGTWLGAWTWAPSAPGNLFSIGNPPSGIPGGYCIIDAVALAFGPAVLRTFQRGSAHPRQI